MDPRDLHPERLSTTDETGARIYVHAEEVSGYWNNRRRILNIFLVIIYFFLPWIYIDGKQSILLNISSREFTFFGTTFYSHDTPLLIFFFLLFTLIFGLITAIWGRVWCGWGCPQTVFIDLIFKKIEVFIEGNAHQQKKLEAQKIDFQKIFKKSLKWILFSIVSLHLSHTFLGYFLGTRELLSISLGSPLDHWTEFLTMLLVFAIILFDFGWFREQFCNIVCPYGRLQSVVMDEHSSIVAYDPRRGEPRKGIDPAKPHGDCVNCFQCVKVCPTGIDIRRGAQLECIHCTKCIDACDDIMERIKKPKGLISYKSEVELGGGKRKAIRPRTIIYAVFILLLTISFIISLSRIHGFSAQLLRATTTPYQVNGEEIINHYKLITHHYSESQAEIEMKTNHSEVKAVARVNPYPIHTGKNEIHVFFKFPKSVLNDGSLKVQLELTKNDEENIQEVNLVGPLK